MNDNNSNSITPLELVSSRPPPPPLRPAIASDTTDGTNIVSSSGGDNRHTSSSSSLEYYRHLPPPPKLIVGSTSTTTTTTTSATASLSTSTARIPVILPPPPIQATSTTAASSSTTTTTRKNTMSSTNSSNSPGTMDSSTTSATKSTASSPYSPRITTTTTTSNRHHRQQYPSSSYYHPLLALRHCSLPILIVGTSTATQTLAHSQNYTSLSQWFQSIVDHTMTMTSSSSNTSVPPIPFRSIQRTIHLDLFHQTKDTSSNNSNNNNRISISVRFLDTETMDSRQQQQPDSLLKAAAASATTSTIHSGDTASTSTDLSMIQITDYLQNIHLTQCKQKQQQKLLLAGYQQQQQQLQQQQSATTELSSSTTTNTTTTTTANHDDITSTTTSNNPSIDLITTLHKFTAMPDLSFMKQTRLVYDELTDFTTHEMFHCPLVILFVATTQEENTNNPIQTFQELLYNASHLPKAFLNGQFDPSDYTVGHGGAKRYMLLLHETNDHTTTTTFDEISIQKQLQSTFPSVDCTVLSMDTNNNNRNYKQLSSFILRMTRDGCIPALERRIVYLNAVVSNAKKGVKNVFKQFWRKPKTANTNPSSDTSTMGSSPFPTSFSSLLGTSTASFNTAASDYYNPTGSTHGGGTTTTLGHAASTTYPMSAPYGAVPYRCDTVESQARLLADSLFLIKDYETALSFYRLVRDDFKMDKAMVYYASIQEMIALCLYAMDNNCYNTTAATFPTSTSSKYSRDTHLAIENALYSYTRAADEEHQQQQQQNNTTTSRTSSSTLPSRPQTSALATRLATRLCFVLSRITPTSTLTPSKLVEIADLLASASSHETPLGAAILLEQASRHYLAAAHWNKYAFHMLMSGHMYRSSRLERHAARCFTASLTIYQRCPQWKELVDHLLSALAQQLYSTEYYSLALLIYVQLMDGSTSGKINSKNLYKFWNHILEICKSKPSEAQVSARLLHDVVLRHNVHKSPSLLLEEIDYMDTTNEKNGFSQETMNLELCNLDLPRIYDNTVEVIEISSIIQRNVNISSTVSSAKLDDPEGSISISPSTEGGEEIETNARFYNEDEDSSPKLLGSHSLWIDMTNTMEAELRASLDTAAIGTSLTADAILSSLRKLETDRAMERKTTSTLLEKQTKSTRACGEPFLVTVVFANPLDVQLQLTEIQLVAELQVRADQSNLTGSNVTRDPTAKNGNSSFFSEKGSAKTWSYNCCPDIVFKVPAFYADSSNSNSSLEEEGGMSPSFCVEVKDVSMDASSVCTVSLAICPLTEGELNIVGLRCKIFDHIWMYHHFSIRGPLLQDTRQHRAYRIRGPRPLLRSIISHEMPLLHVDVKLDAAFDESAESASYGCAPTMLQGEVSTGYFRLRNVGRAPAFRIYLKTNTPSICLLNQYNEATLEKVAYERMATSSCVGPSGTLMQLLPNGVLEPGDSVEVPFQLKASGGGKRELYCLFSYEPYGHYSNLTTPYSFKNNGVRIIKKLLDLFVYPSLTVSASVIPSFCDKGESVLSLELTNCRSDRQDQLEIVLKEVVMCSRFYSAYKIEDNLEQRASSLSIGWQERIVLHYRLVPSVPDDGSCIISECEKTTNLDVLEKKDSSMLFFACLEHAHGTFMYNAATYRRRLARLAQQRDVAQIRRDKSKISPSFSSVNLLSEVGAVPSRSSSTIADTDAVGEGATEPLEGTSLMSLCCPPDPHIINIICTWQGVGCANSHNNLVFGNHHVLHLPVRPLPSQEQRFLDVSFPLTLSAKYNANVYHDFSVGIATVPFEVTVRNKYAPGSKELPQNPTDGNNAVEFEFSFIPQTDYELAGVKSFRGKLLGGEDISIPMKAFFLTQGMYNLQCIRLTVYEEEGEELSQIFPMQWIVHVQEKREARLPHC